MIHSESTSPEPKLWTLRKPVYADVRRVLVDMTEIEFKCWASKIDEDESEIIKEFKTMFRQAYDIYKREEDFIPLMRWNDYVQDYYSQNLKKKKKARGK